MALMEMYLQRVSTRKVKAVTEAFRGHEFRCNSWTRNWANAVWDWLILTSSGFALRADLLPLAPNIAGHRIPVPALFSTAMWKSRWKIRLRQIQKSIPFKVL